MYNYNGKANLGELLEIRNAFKLYYRSGFGTTLITRYLLLFQVEGAFGTQAYILNLILEIFHKHFVGF